MLSGACNALQALGTGIAAVSIVAVFFTPPVGSEFKHQSTVRSLNVLVAFFFTVDAVLKCLAHGVLLTPTAYLQVSARFSVAVGAQSKVGACSIMVKSSNSLCSPRTLV